MKTVVCVSDTHNALHKITIPSGDILIHAGDLTGRGTLGELASACATLEKLPHPHKVVIAGNHDWCFVHHGSLARQMLVDVGCTYLEDEAATVAGLKFWGAPWQPEFGAWAFNLERGEELAKKWALIPDGLDFLVTHGPPHGIRDFVSRGELVGCEELLVAVRRARPRYHVFGHIHQQNGVVERDGTTFVNAACLNDAYRVTYAPWVLEVE